jgi:hypothetical protein
LPWKDGVAAKKAAPLRKKPRRCGKSRAAGKKPAPPRKKPRR